MKRNSILFSAIIVLFISFTLTFSACGGDETDPPDDPVATTDGSTNVEADGDPSLPQCFLPPVNNTQFSSRDCSIDIYIFEAEAEANVNISFKGEEFCNNYAHNSTKTTDQWGRAFFVCELLPFISELDCYKLTGQKIILTVSKPSVCNPHSFEITL